MNRGLFAAQLNEAWNVLGMLGLDADRVWHPTYPAHLAAHFRSLSYLQVWRTCYAEQYYDFLLADNSVIQLRATSFQPLRVSYAYYECPFDAPSYADFVESEVSVSAFEAGDEFREEYENFLLACPPKAAITPIRYDYDPDRYTEGIHPASHFHLGHANSVRIATHRILRPLSFLLFVLRQRYPIHWPNLLAQREAPVWCRNIRDALDSVEDAYIHPNDMFEMILQ